MPAALRLPALVLLVSIGLVSPAGASVTPFGTPIARTVRVHSDPGGVLDVYIARYNTLRDAGAHLIIDGSCNSACTLFMGIIPRHRVCLTAAARFGFHTASERAVDERYLGEPGTWPVIQHSPEGTALMWRHYPPLVRAILARRGMDGIQPHPDLVYINGRGLKALYRRCEAAELRSSLNTAISGESRQEQARTRNRDKRDGELTP